MEGLY